MEKTTQFNIRLPKTMVYDMEYIAEHLNISRNDWLKFKIAEMVLKEKLKIMNSFEERFVKGLISKDEFRKHMGFNPSPEIRKKLDDFSKEKEKIEFAQKKYFKELVKKVESENE
jgi:hypothetical protein